MPNDASGKRNAVFFEPGAFEAPPTPTSCQRFCCSDFLKFKDPPNLTHVSDLQNEPLNLFSSLETDSKNWDWEAIRPSCQLTSLLLLSAPKYIVTMTEGLIQTPSKHGKPINVKTISDVEMIKSNKDGRFRYPYISRHPKPQHANTEYCTLRARKILENLAEMVDFQARPLSDGTRDMMTALRGPLPAHLANVFPDGRRCLVTINEAIYKRLVKATRRKKEGRGSQESLLKAQFSFASTLLHELGHALNCAVQGTLSLGEPFYEDCAVAEGGFALEAAVFGGNLDGDRMLGGKIFEERQGLCSVAAAAAEEGEREREELFVLYAWPCGITQAEYARAGGAMRAKERLPLRTKVERVELGFIERLFSEGFWKVVAIMRSCEPLAVPRRGEWSIGLDAETGKRYVCESGRPDKTPLEKPLPAVPEEKLLDEPPKTKRIFIHEWITRKRRRRSSK